MRRRSRPRQIAALLFLTFIGLTIYFIQRKPELKTAPFFPIEEPKQPIRVPKLPSESLEVHPIPSLISEARDDFESLQARQSKSLFQAVTEYRRRYGVHPPPHFDTWYAFAKKKGVRLIDEYDTIYDIIKPFWALQPKTIRARAREAMGFDNNLIGVLLRDKRIVRMEGGRGWMQKAILDMVAEFAQFLPDLDLCFNTYDEPRVILPHEDLARLVRKAETVNMPAANAVEFPRNEWSWRPADVNDGSRINQIKTTRFNRMEHQRVWSHARMSCPPDSAARFLDESDDIGDDVESYGVAPFGFIKNQTAFSDVCNSPSFSSTIGLFSGPNVYDVVHDLFPIFSQSKISTFQDILYPSPWYYANKVEYDETVDMAWEEKEGKMYWRGSTTGGFSQNGGWRQQHRQYFVHKATAEENAQIMFRANHNWTIKEVWRPDFKDIFDVRFSHVGQCDRGDCAAQKEFFHIASAAKPQEAWKWKYLLDIDGNAFSGRFYAFLKSKSLVYKLAVFREWHADWIKPWVHYIPLTLRGDDWLEAIRWFVSEEDGKVEAERLALAGREWAGKALRNEDMEVWFFRLLLEYGRLVDDNREKIGFVPRS